MRESELLQLARGERIHGGTEGLAQRDNGVIQLQGEIDRRELLTYDRPRARAQRQ